MRWPVNRTTSTGGLKGTVKDRQMLIRQFRRAFDFVVLVDIGRDCLNLGLIVPQCLECLGHGLIDHFEHPASSQLFVFHQGNIWFDTSRVAVHEETNGTGRCQHGRLSVAESDAFTRTEYIIPQRARCRYQIGRASWINVFNGIAMHLHHT